MRAGQQDKEAWAHGGLTQIICMAVVLFAMIGCKGPQADAGSASALEPQVSACHSYTPARKSVVFLLDVSGSMMPEQPLLLNELERAIEGIDERQEFTVICFSGRGVYEMTSEEQQVGLRRSTSRYKQDVIEWLSEPGVSFKTGGRGSTHVKPALMQALSYEPSLIFLISDNLTDAGSNTENELVQDDLLDMIHTHNQAEPPARFNTFQFIRQDPLVSNGLQGTLERIAEETDGNYRFIGRRDLNLR